MTTTQSLSMLAAWFLFGMARMVFTMTMVEHRVDHPEWAKAIGFTRQAAKARVTAANYNARGKRLLPWYRAVGTTYWFLVAGAFLSAVHFS